MTITRVGSNAKYADGWDNIFAGETSDQKSTASKAVKAVKKAVKNAAKTVAAAVQPAPTKKKSTAGKPVAGVTKKAVPKSAPVKTAAPKKTVAPKTTAVRVSPEAKSVKSVPKATKKKGGR